MHFKWVNSLFLAANVFMKFKIILNIILNRYIWLLDGTLTGTTTPSQSGPGSNGYEGILYIPRSSVIGASPSNDLVSYPHSSKKYIYPLLYMPLHVILKTLNLSILTLRRMKIFNEYVYFCFKKRVSKYIWGLTEKSISWCHNCCPWLF